MGGPGGPGTNPEQLFAAGYAACFQSALLRIASGRKLDVSDSRITARVGIGPLSSGGFGLAAALDLDARGSVATKRSATVDRAQLCPIRGPRAVTTSKVTLSVGGAALERPGGLSRVGESPACLPGVAG